MPTISANSFSGMAPLIDPRKLPDQGAALAQWVKFDGTDIRAWRDPVAIDYDTGSGSDIGPSGLTITRLFRFTVLTTSGAFSARRWLAWEGLRAIDPVPSPIPADQYSRLYWTEGGAEMKVCSSPTMSQTLGATPGVRLVGIPAPIERPTATAVDDSAATSAQPLEITNAKPAVVTFSANPFTEGQQVQITITTPADATAQNMRELSGKTFIATGVTATQLTLTGSDTSAYSDFVDPGAALISAVFSESDFEDRVYVFTLVSDWGEEGPPSPPSEIVTVRRDGGKATVTLTWARPNGYDHIMTMRVYRTLSGEDGTRFFFVKDVPFTGGGPGSPVIVQFEDDVQPIKIGELIPSTEWTAPVIGMFGLLAMPNGYMIAFKGNTVYACEAYQPQAWPDRYRKTLEFEVVGAAAMGQSAVIATSGRPYLATGSDPASLTVQDLPVDAPCISARSIVSIGAGVVYATYDGLVLITPAGARLVTQNVLTKQQWASVWSGQMQAGFHDGRYIVFSQSDAFPSFSMRPDGDDIQYVTFPGLYGRACATDTANDTLCFITRDGSGFYRRLMRFDGALTLHSYTWRSKVYTLSAPCNFSVAQVFASDYPVAINISAQKPNGLGGVTPMVTVIDHIPPSAQPFRLPSGFTAREWQFTFTGTASIQRFDMATSISELRAI